MRLPRSASPGNQEVSFRDARAGSGPGVYWPLVLTMTAPPGQAARSREVLHPGQFADGDDLLPTFTTSFHVLAGNEFQFRALAQLLLQGPAGWRPRGPQLAGLSCATNVRNDRPGHWPGTGQTEDGPHEYFRIACELLELCRLHLLVNFHRRATLKKTPYSSSRCPRTAAPTLMRALNWPGLADLQQPFQQRQREHRGLGRWTAQPRWTALERRLGGAQRIKHVWDSSGWPFTTGRLNRRLLLRSAGRVIS